MFDFFKKKKTPELIIGSPVKGKTVPLSSVNDPTFIKYLLVPILYHFHHLLILIL